MLENMHECKITYSVHAQVKMAQRQISKDLIESSFKDPTKFIVAHENSEKHNYEILFRKSSKYRLKVVVAKAGDNELKVITAFIMNRKKWQKTVKLWQKMPR